jgi:hypothetical protein
MRSMARTTQLRLALAAFALVLGSSGGTAGPQHPYRTEASVCISLTVKDDLPGPVFTTLRDEATRIWLTHGVALLWTQPAPVSCDTFVPMVFDDARVRALAGPKRDAAMALTEFSARGRIVYVSAPSAFRLLSAPGSHLALMAEGEWSHRGGILLGRVVAHELGHVLLETTAHSKRGLMRPVFSVNDALSADRQATTLTSLETTRLAARFSLVPIDAPDTPDLLARRER